MATAPNHLADDSAPKPLAEAAPESSRSGSRNRGSRKIWLARLVIVIVAVAAFANSFPGAFVYDDIDSIRDNKHIRRLFPLSESTSWAMLNGGETVARRPLLSLTFALNYAISKGETWSYHLGNLLIHAAAGLLLFGIVRRTLDLPLLHKRYGEKSVGLALAAAMIWTVHPLQTESVTYIAQRAESLMGMLFLLTLYCSLRGFQSERPKRWYFFAIVVSAAGMLVKEVMFTAPLLVFLYDGIFLSSGFFAAWRKRWSFYFGLAATWGALAAVQYAGRAGVADDFTVRSPLAYAMTQPGVILYYLWLSVRPDPLAMVYDWPFAETFWRIGPPAVVVGLLLAATFWAVVRRKPYGYLGAWFFLILVPTSTFVALNQNIQEHRLYLSLAALVVGFVLVGEYILKLVLVRDLAKHARFVSALLVLMLVAHFLAQTISRNFHYHINSMLWKDNVLHYPNSAVARNNYGYALGLEMRQLEAIPQLEEAIRLDPAHAMAYYNLANAQADLGRLDEAIVNFRKAIELRPNFVFSRLHLGKALFENGKFAEAEAAYREALRIDPSMIQAHVSLGTALLAQEKSGEAIAEFEFAQREFAISGAADSPQLHYYLGQALAQEGRVPAALQQFHTALIVDEKFFLAHFDLGLIAEQQENLTEAADRFAKVVNLQPEFGAAHFKLADILARQGKYDVAAQQFSEVIKLDLQNWAAHMKLGQVYLRQQKRELALEHLNRAVELAPDSTEAKQALLDAQQGKIPEFGPAAPTGPLGPLPAPAGPEKPASVDAEKPATEKK